MTLFRLPPSRRRLPRRVVLYRVGVCRRHEGGLWRALGSRDVVAWSDAQVEQWLEDGVARKARWWQW